jgi:hypothetical protein
MRDFLTPGGGGAVKYYFETPQQVYLQALSHRTLFHVTRPTIVFAEDTLGRIDKVVRLIYKGGNPTPHGGAAGERSQGNTWTLRSGFAG